MNACLARWRGLILGSAGAGTAWVAGRTTAGDAGETRATLMAPSPPFHQPGRTAILGRLSPRDLDQGLEQESPILAGKTLPGRQDRAPLLPHRLPRSRSPLQGLRGHPHRLLCHGRLLAPAGLPGVGAPPPRARGAR